MLQKLQKRKNESGFTIIEVLIVLAIAALIFLIVFLAVPALQRNSRNNGRKNDAARFSTSIANWISNNNGTLPGSESGSLVGATFQTDCQTIQSDAGTLSQFGTLTCSATPGTATVQFAGIYIIPSTFASGSPSYTSSGRYDGLLYAEQAVCPSTTTSVGTSLTLTQGNARQSALVYTLETTGSGPYNLACIQVT